jgi:hypothetical protein
MTCEYLFRGSGRGAARRALACLVGAALLSGCTELKRSIGMEQSMPDEFAVESRAPLLIPPDFDLRPPTPGAPRPQEKTAEQQARQVMEQAGPGEPGKQAPDFRLRRSADALGPGGSQSPDPTAAVGEQSLASKLLGAGDTGAAAVEKRETTPLKGVY